MDAQADPSLRWVYTHFVGFVMSRLKCFCSPVKGALLHRAFTMAPPPPTGRGGDNGENVPVFYLCIVPSVPHVSRFLAHLSRRLTRWAYSIPMVHRPSVVVVCRPHFQTWISLKPFGQSRSDIICSITGVGERLKTLVSMATESPHWLIMGKMVSPPFLGCFWSDPFYTFR